MARISKLSLTLQSQETTQITSERGAEPRTRGASRSYLACSLSTNKTSIFRYHEDEKHVESSIIQSVSDSQTLVGGVGRKRETERERERERER